MTDADLLRIAQECGLGKLGISGDRAYFDPYFATKQNLHWFADRIRAEARAETIEECAKVCDRISAGTVTEWPDNAKDPSTDAFYSGASMESRSCAAAIRALGEAVR